eukprot:TRINITY_DN6455_c0_g1_i2.p1 TRINITY_DN6455_c0_g1~~TRINITY_DN6455_c0_g1_i2.p1  ORF type:complete len:436 (-),score=52.10 TRINITY_DN6455_c0_g1_i2:21-1328(-)
MVLLRVAGAAVRRATANRVRCVFCIIVCCSVAGMYVQLICLDGDLSQDAWSRCMSRWNGRKGTSRRPRLSKKDIRESQSTCLNGTEWKACMVYLRKLNNLVGGDLVKPTPNNGGGGMAATLKLNCSSNCSRTCSSNCTSDEGGMDATLNCSPNCSSNCSSDGGGMDATLNCSPNCSSNCSSDRGGMAARLNCSSTCSSNCASHGGRNVDLFYRHIWKNAGQYVSQNLLRLGSFRRPVAERPKGRDGYWESEQACERLQQRKRSNESTNPGVLFTFVREPIGRLVSGYSEIEKRGDWKNDKPLGSKNRAVDFIAEVTSGKYNDGHVGRQVQFFAGHLRKCPVAFDFVGRVESLDRDLEQLGQLLGCEGLDKKFNSTQGRHSKSGYANNSLVVAGMEEALRDPAILTTVCKFHFPDFVVLGYPLRPRCKHLLPLVEI